MVKLNESPVGTIVFKNRSAHRKIEDRAAWDRLKQSSPVYNGDTIRTAEASVAIITFQDEVTRVDLSENTLIQIFYTSEEGARIDLAGGMVDVASGGRSVYISNGVSAFELGGNSEASLNKDDGGFGFSVLKGQAVYDGTEHGSGSVAAFTQSGGPDARPAIAMTSFGSNARIFKTDNAPVRFSWNSANFTPDTRVVIEVSLDTGYSRIVETQTVSGTSASVFLPQGSYFWRAYPVEGGSTEPAGRMYPSGRIEVVPAGIPELRTPAEGRRFVFSDESSVPLSWSVVDGAAGYLLEIAGSPAMTSPVLARRVQANSIVQNGLEPGSWYWRVTPLFSTDGEIFRQSSSSTGEFSIVRGSPEMEAPVLTYPVQNATLNLDRPNVVWKHDPFAASYFLEVADNPRMSNPLVQLETVSNYHNLANLLELGKTYYWRVSARAQGVSLSSATGSFTAGSENYSPRPPVEAAVVPAPEPVPVPVPVPVLEPVPEPVPAPVVEVVSLVQPLDIPEPEPEPEPVLSATPAEQSPGQLFAAGNIQGGYPLHGQLVSIRQLAGVSSMDFVWEGLAQEYRFALYQVNGDIVVPPTIVRSHSFTLENPSKLAAGDYIWEVIEWDSRQRILGRSTAAQFTVSGDAPARRLPTSDPGVLYGRR
ncbi:MAG: FecR family protein [Treponema sp.]|nr:FecR family protein [Treponema sp.]